MPNQRARRAALKFSWSARTRPRARSRFQLAWAQTELDSHFADEAAAELDIAGADRQRREWWPPMSWSTRRRRLAILT